MSNERREPPPMPPEVRRALGNIELAQQILLQSAQGRAIDRSTVDTAFDAAKYFDQKATDMLQPKTILAPPPELMDKFKR